MQVIVSDFALHHVMAFMIALASLGNPHAQRSYIIEEVHEGAIPTLMEAIRTPAGYKITTVETRRKSSANADGRGVFDPLPVSVPVLMREMGNSPRGVSEGGAQPRP